MRWELGMGKREYVRVFWLCRLVAWESWDGFGGGKGRAGLGIGGGGGGLLEEVGSV